MECTPRKAPECGTGVGTQWQTWPYCVSLTSANRSLETKGGSKICAGLSSVLSTPRNTQPAWGSSALALCLPGGQLNLHMETGFYITSWLVTSMERVSVHTKSVVRSLVPTGALGCLGLLLGPRRKVSEWTPRSASPPFTWTSDGNGAWGHHHSSIWSVSLFEGPYLGPKPESQKINNKKVSSISSCNC